MRRTLTAAVASCALAATPLLTAPAGAEEAAPVARPKVIASHLVAPLSLAVTPKGGVWFSQNFAGMLMQARPGGHVRAVFQAGRGTEVGAVSVHRRVVTFATTGTKGNTSLRTWTRRGGVEKVASLSRYERRHNPDGAVTYGITDLDQSCADQWPTKQAGPPTYTGIVESHPYASLTRRGTTYVADAAANAILGVTDGVVRTVALLPAQTLEITAEAAQATGIPECAVGHVYGFEPVPTDVEMGPDGMLYVSTLPGGPEDPSLGARAAVHRIDPASGTVETMATGLLSATGLAVRDNGDVYVAELFRNRIAVVSPDGSVRKFRRATMPGDVEFVKGRVWATRKVLAQGQVVRYPR